MLIFFLIVFTIYFFANLYLFLKGFRAIPQGGNLRTIYIIVFLFLASTFIAGKFLERADSSVFSDILNIIGGFWMAFMLYGILLFVISDITFLILKITGVLDQESIPVYRKWAFLATMCISALLITAGFFNAVTPVVKKYDITINKPAGDIKSFRIAAVSDIHLGSIIRKRSMKKHSRSPGSRWKTAPR